MQVSIIHEYYLDLLIEYIITTPRSLKEGVIIYYTEISYANQSYRIWFIYIHHDFIHRLHSSR